MKALTRARFAVAILLVLQVVFSHQQDAQNAPAGESSKLESAPQLVEPVKPSDEQLTPPAT